MAGVPDSNCCHSMGVVLVFVMDDLCSVGTGFCDEVLQNEDPLQYAFIPFL